jgi:hypothetical protein
VFSILFVVGFVLVGWLFAVASCTTTASGAAAGAPLATHLARARRRDNGSRPRAGDSVVLSTRTIEFAARAERQRERG